MGHIRNIVAGLALVAGFAACERMPEKNTVAEEQRLQDSVRAVQVRDSVIIVREKERAAAAEAKAKEASPSKTVNASLQQDARLARTMSLEKFTRHMQARKGYYSQFKEVKYEDEYVTIKMEDGEMKIETPKGKAKFDEDETKIKTDTYKRKTERD